MLSADSNISLQLSAGEFQVEHMPGLSSILQSAQVIVVQIDRDFNILFANEHTSGVFGYGPQGLNGRNVLSTILPENDGSLRNLRAMFARIRKERERYQSFVLQHARKAGGKLWVAWNATPVVDAADELQGILFFGNDITGIKEHEGMLQTNSDETEAQLKEAYRQLEDETSIRKWAENVLKKSEEKYRLVVENAREGIVVDQDGFFKYANKRCFTILGYSESELMSMPIVSVVHPDDRESLEQRNLWMLNGKNTTQFFSCRIIDKDGRIKWIEMNSVIITWMGRPAILSFFNNITERKRAEREVMAYQEKLLRLASEISLAEERERRRIAVGLHDQIGQPLVLTKMKLGALRNSLQSEGAMALMDSISGLIGEAISNTKSLTFQLSPPVLYELGFEAALEWLGEQVQKEHDIAFIFENDGSHKPLEKDVSVLMYQAVRELVINVVKHARADRFKISVRKEKHEISVAVVDDGVGFEESEVGASSFGFFSITERLKRFKGRFWVNSVVGYGTCASLSAPLMEQWKTTSIT